MKRIKWEVHFDPRIDDDSDWGLTVWPNVPGSKHIFKGRLKNYKEVSEKLEKLDNSFKVK